MSENNDDEPMAWSAWLGKRSRDASSENEGDEPQVRRARSQEEQPQQAKLVAEALPADTAKISASSSWPLNGSDSKKSPSERPLAEKLSDYLEEGGTLKFAPRPEWYRPCSVGRKRPRESSVEPPPRAETLLPPPVAAAALQQGRLEAPANGLLPDDAFVQYLQQEVLSSQPPAPLDTSLDSLPVVVADPIAKSESSLDIEALLEPRLATFGRECDSALHVAIRQMAMEASLELIQLGASVHAENAKAVTPLILASQKGSLEVVQELWKRGACIQQTSHTGSTPLIQAAHFGHLPTVKFLLEMGASMEKANNHNTTPLMRAAQEGHSDIVRLLLKNGAEVNRKNNEQMSALMLASQRGHFSIVQMLIDSGAHLDDTTQQDSTSLMLACKRGQFDVVRVLVTNGCEIWMRDVRGRTARDMAVRKNEKQLMKLLDPDVQVKLMQRKARIERNYTMIQMWTLLQQERAHVPLMHKHVVIHEVGKDLLINKGSLSALIRTMTLPAPLVELVSSFLPLPHLWDQRSALIMKRCTVDPDAAIASSLEIIDEVLDEGGFVRACDEAQVTPPTNFSSWSEWKAWGHRFKEDTEESSEGDRPPARRSALAIGATLHGLGLLDFLQQNTASPAGIPERPKESYVQMRREICFLQLLAHRTTMLARVLNLPPYNMPPGLIQQMITVSDIQSLSRRMGSQGVHFEASVAIEMLFLVNSVCTWFSGVRSMEQETVGSPGQYSAYSNGDGTPSSTGGSVSRIALDHTTRSLLDS